MPLITCHFSDGASFEVNAMIPRIAPVSQEMIRNFIAEQVLDQPRSY